MSTKIIAIVLVAVIAVAGIGAGDTPRLLYNVGMAPCAGNRDFRRSPPWRSIRRS